MDDFNDISRIIAANQLGTPLSEAEKERLEAWLQASESNRQLYDRIGRLHATRQILRLEEENYGQQMAERFRQTIAARPLRRRDRRRLYAWIGSTAAAILLILSVALYKNHSVHSGGEPRPDIAQTIQPGKTEALLTLAGGETICLGDADDAKNVEALIDSLYTPDADEADRGHLSYHTLSIPSGGEYFCRLDDNTAVWLNSQTELRFPRNFGKHERKVYLKGEAFFDVAHDSQRPFIVSMEQGDIRVYGTRFNLTNYDDTPLTAVLVEGSISFTPPAGSEVKMKPSEKLTYEAEKDAISICEVDTSLYTAWVNHLFVFDGQPLEEIMNTLARWYDFKVSFASDELRHIRLSGQLYRHDDIRPLLESYEQITGLHFIIQGKTISINK